MGAVFYVVNKNGEKIIHDESGTRINGNQRNNSIAR